MVNRTRTKKFRITGKSSYKRRRFKRGVARIARRVVLNVNETKYSASVSNSGFTTDGNIQIDTAISGGIIPQVPQGLTVNNRVGDKVIHRRTRYTSLTLINLNVAEPINGASLDTGLKARFLFLQPRKGVSVAQMQAYITSLTTAGDIYQELDLEKVKILKQKKLWIPMYFIAPTGIANENPVYSTPAMTFRWNYTDKKRRILQYDESTGAPLGTVIPYNIRVYNVMMYQGVNGPFQIDTCAQTTMFYKDS